MVHFPSQREFILVAKALLVATMLAALGLTAHSNQPAGDQAALIKKLIEQLGSPKFVERDAAMKQLEHIGEPALDALRKAAKTATDLEAKRRVETLADQIDLAVLETLVKGGIRHHQEKDFKKADALFDKAIKKGLQRFHPETRKTPPGEVPYLTELFLHSARTAKELGDFEKAGRAYNRAAYYSNDNRDKRREIDAELRAMTNQLVSGWTKAVTAKADQDPALKALLAKHQIVVLHSRRYAGGGYLKSAYSFLYEAGDEGKHRNDVQLLFDNGLRDKSFDINMLVGQENRVADLGAADFDKSPDPAKIGADKKTRWQSDRIKAIEGHVYLENVKDDRGNNFFVLFRIVAVDPDSRYVAFVWRRLPGGMSAKEE